MHQPSHCSTPRFTRTQSNALKPLVSATAAALLGMAAGQAQAIGCSTNVSSAVTATQYVCNNLTVTSGGAIDVTAANGVTVSSGNEANTSVTNAGRITGNTTAIYVQDTYSGVSTSITNTGMLAGTDYAVNRAGSSHPVYITNNTNGQMVGGIVASSLNNYDLVTLKSNVTLSDIRNTGGVATAALNGSYIGESGSTLRVAIASPASYSYLSAASTQQNGGTLDVDVKANSGIAAGNAFQVIRSGSHSGQFDTITDNSAMFNFTQRVVSSSSEGAGIYIDAVRALAAEQAARNRNNIPGVGAAKVLDSGASGLASVVSALGNLSTEQAVSNAISQTLPLLTGGSMVAAQNALSGINRVIQARVEGNQGLSSGDEFLGDKHVWLKPFGSWADQGDQDGVAGYKANTTGFALGVDGTRSGDLRLGGAFAYVKSHIDSNSATAPQSSEVDVYQLVGYGSYRLDEKTEFSFQGDVGMNHNNGRRQIALTSVTAASSYDSLSLHMGGSLGRTYALDDKNKLTASLRADYTRIDDNGYTESGAGALNLGVQSRAAEALVLGIDGKLAHTLTSHSTLTANLGVGYDALNQQSSITAAFAGAPGAAFTTYGLNPSPWLLRGGVGVVRMAANGLEVSARYDAEYRENFLNQTASVKFRWLF
jgi:outer membrane autotransporter protein